MTREESLIVTYILWKKIIQSIGLDLWLWEGTITSLEMLTSFLQELCPLQYWQVEILGKFLAQQRIKCCHTSEIALGTAGDTARRSSWTTFVHSGPYTSFWNYSYQCAWNWNTQLPTGVWLIYNSSNQVVCISTQFQLYLVGRLLKER